MIMLPITMTATVLLTLLLAALWHDKPARQPVIEQRRNRKRLPL
jgi:hypothetical protein